MATQRFTLSAIGDRPVLDLVLIQSEFSRWRDTIYFPFRSCSEFTPSSARATFGGENTPESWDKTRASQYLDRRGEDWFKFGGAYRGQGTSTTSCVSCHSLLPYALARPVLRRLSHASQPTRWETKILEQTKQRVANWDRLDSAKFQLFYDFDDAKKCSHAAPSRFSTP